MTCSFISRWSSGLLAVSAEAWDISSWSNWPSITWRVKKISNQQTDSHPVNCRAVFLFSSNTWLINVPRLSHQQRSLISSLLWLQIHFVSSQKSFRHFPALKSSYSPRGRCRSRRGDTGDGAWPEASSSCCSVGGRSRETSKQCWCEMTVVQSRRWKWNQEPGDGQGFL